MKNIHVKKVFSMNDKVYECNVIYSKDVGKKPLRIIKQVYDVKG